MQVIDGHHKPPFIYIWYLQCMESLPKLSHGPRSLVSSYLCRTSCCSELRGLLLQYYTYTWPGHHRSHGTVSDTWNHSTVWCQRPWCLRCLSWQWEWVNDLVGAERAIQSEVYDHLGSCWWTDSSPHFPDYPAGSADFWYSDIDSFRCTFHELVKDAKVPVSVTAQATTSNPAWTDHVPVHA